MLTPERLPTLERPDLAPLQVPEPRTGRRVPGWAILSGLTAAALLLRIPTIGRAYWVDEAISVGIASHPLRDLPGLLRLDGSPPLWYVILHFWMLAFGSTPVATHILALLISLTITPLAYWAGRTLFSKTAGFAAAGLATANPFLGWYATENRMYSLLVALALVALTLTVKAVRDRNPRAAVGAVIAFTALDYTHNWALYLTLVTGVYVLVRAVLARDRRLALATVAAGAVVLALYAPWIPSLLRQTGYTAAPWAVPPGIGDLFADPTTALAGTLGALAVPVLVGAIIWTRREPSRDTKETALFLATITACTTLLGWAVSYIEPSWTVRYLAVTVPGWLLAISGMLASSRRGRQVLVGVAAVLSAWLVAGNLLPNANPAYAKDNGGAIAAAASSQLKRGDLVIVTQTEELPVMHYYLPAGLTYYNPMGKVNDPGVVNWTNIIQRLQRTNACRTILPAIARLPVGAHVLEVDPRNAVGTSGSAWSKAVNHQVNVIEYLLTHEPSLRSTISYNQALRPKPYVPAIGELFVKQRGPTVCPPTAHRR